MQDVHDLTPVDRGEFFEAVAPCLTLAAGVGMSQADQDAWLEAAFQALEGIPIALLHRGARAAMHKAEHPSKIIPAITAEIGDAWRWRRENPASAPQIAGPRPSRTASALMDARGKPMSEEETGILNAHLEWLGSPVRYRADGSKHNAARAA